MNRLRPQPPPIASFEGDHLFLSNFSPDPVVLDGLQFPTAEHAFQSLKTDIKRERLDILAAATPGDAKRVGRRVTLREDWDWLRIPAMRRVLRAKFGDPDLARALLATGRRQLIEGNWWGDCFWGVSGGRGENHLGRLLMDLREDMRRSIG